MVGVWVAQWGRLACTHAESLGGVRKGGHGRARAPIRPCRGWRMTAAYLPGHASQPIRPSLKRMPCRVPHSTLRYFPFREYSYEMGCNGKDWCSKT